MSIVYRNVLYFISSIVFSAVDDFTLKNNFNLKSKVKSKNTTKENTVKNRGSRASPPAWI